MLKFVLFAMIGYKLDMGETYWYVLCAYVVHWVICKIMGWL